MERIETARPPASKRGIGAAPLTTDKRLIAAAKELLDTGGEGALTLRAVGHASGISHNAPYKHFKNRDAILSAVATADFETLASSFRDIRVRRLAPGTKLMQALHVVIDFSVGHPARYRLLFNDPSIAALGGEFERTALATFGEFVLIVKECQAAGTLPNTSETIIAGLLFATMHGLIALKANGRMHQEKGLSSVEAGLKKLIQLLAPLNLSKD